MGDHMGDATKMIPAIEQAARVIAEILSKEGEPCVSAELIATRTTQALSDAGLLAGGWRPMSECPNDDTMVLARRDDGAMMVWRSGILMHKPTPAHLEFSPTGWIACDDLNRLPVHERKGA